MMVRTNQEKLTGDKLAAVRLATQAGVLYEEIELLLETGSPELLGRLFGGGDPGHLIADLGALLANANRVIGEEEP